MFYCDECRVLHNYPESMVKSRGHCEICGELAVCNDVPTSELSSNSIKMLDDFLKVEIPPEVMILLDDGVDVVIARAMLMYPNKDIAYSVARNRMEGFVYGISRCHQKVSNPRVMAGLQIKYSEKIRKEVYQ